MKFLDTQFIDEQNRIMRQRTSILRQVHEDPSLALTYIKRCEQDVKFFINYFIFTYNPRSTPSILPMIMFPRQEDMIDTFQEAYETGKWCIVNKSRATGASVISIAFMLHKLLFSEGFSGSLSSNKADSVDRIGDPDSLFGKLEQMYKMLPHWLKPFNIDDCRKIKLIVNPHNNSTIKGYSGRDIGRGGRSTIAFVDEIAWLDWDTQAIAAMSENTDCLIGVSTPRGTDTEHYRLFNSPETLNFTFRWSDDPRRSQAWADKQRIMLGDSIFEQELNCSFSAFEGDSFLSRSLVEHLSHDDNRTVSHYKVGEHRYNRVAGLDLANGGDKTILTILDENEVVAIAKLDADFNTMFEQLKGMVKKHRVDFLIYDACGLGAMFAALNDKDAEGLDCTIYPYNAAGTQKDSYIPWYERPFNEVFYNNRAFCYSLLAQCAQTAKNIVEGSITPKEALELGLPQLKLPKSTALVDDMVKAQATFRSGKLLIESKADMRKRGVSSTDLSDSLMMCLYGRYMYL